MYARVRRTRIDVGPASRCGAARIADRILDAQGHELEALNGRAYRRHVDTYGVIDREPAAPRQGVSGFVDILFGTVFALADLPKHAAGDATFQVHPIAKSELARKAYATCNLGDVVSS